MLSWQKNKVNKTEYDILAEEYEKIIGKPWPEKVGFYKSTEDTIIEMKKCIAEKSERVFPDYRKGVVY